MRNNLKVTIDALELLLITQQVVVAYLQHQYLVGELFALARHKIWLPQSWHGVTFFSGCASIISTDVGVPLRHDE